VENLAMKSPALKKGIEPRAAYKYKTEKSEAFQTSAERLNALSPRK
jgi:hypothetical protein